MLHKTHHLPHFRRTYNPEDTKRGRNPISQQQAMAELIEVITTTKPDGFEPTIVKQTADYVYVEYKSPFFGCAPCAQAGASAARVAQCVRRRCCACVSGCLVRYAERVWVVLPSQLMITTQVR